jgi:hypothetical protein
MKDRTFYRRPNGISYVYIPIGVDRDAFVSNCLNTGTIFMINEEGEAIKNVKVGFFTIQRIVFPKDAGQKGSMVSWVNISQYSTPVVVDVYLQSDESFGLLENEFEVGKDYEENSVVVGGNAESADLTISSYSPESSSIRITSSGSDDSKVSIVSEGDLEIEAQKSISSYTSGTYNIESTEDCTVQAENLKARVESIEVNDGNIGLVKEEIIDVISDFLDLFVAHTHIALGTPTAPPNNAPQVAPIKVNLQTTTTNRIKVDQ